MGQLVLPAKLRPPRARGADLSVGLLVRGQGFWAWPLWKVEHQTREGLAVASRSYSQVWVKLPMVSQRRKLHRYRLVGPGSIFHIACKTKEVKKSFSEKKSKFFGAQTRMNSVTGSRRGASSQIASRMEAQPAATHDRGSAVIPRHGACPCARFHPPMSKSNASW